jgi:hypothetical protein
MTVRLPKPIADYLTANARLNPDAMLQPFGAKARVRDDGGDHRGPVEIRSWIEDATIASRAVFTPDAVREEDGVFVVDGLTTGDFKGSPLRFTLRFALDGDAIQALEIGQS